jgi:translation initiation factor IF-1
MAQDECIRLTGLVVEVLPSTTFKVRVSDDHTVLAYLSGRMRKAKIKIILGDSVEIELSPYDLTKARIVYRLK